MRAAQVGKLDGPSAIEIVDLPEPVVYPGGVLIDVHAAGIAFPDPSASRPGDLRATILFANDQTTLDAEATRRLDTLLAAIPPAAHLRITGYTDTEVIGQPVALLHFRASAAALAATVEPCSPPAV